MSLSTLPDTSLLSEVADVSHETIERLEIFETLLKRWQSKTNLVSNSTLAEFWTRHVADSAQVFALAPDASRWVDLGSGGGFPGLVTAILMAERGRKSPESSVILIESNAKKCAFLREVTREIGVADTGVEVSIRQDRIENVLPAIADAQAVTARALAPLKELLTMISLFPGSDKPPALLHKGRDHAAEAAEARKMWAFDLIEHPSFTEDGAVILEISGLKTLKTGGSAG